ncbi:hypothetical protein PanWU01x14_129030 [Parasponia andersonii]|uniref:Uncharacterized protein n=1 Tax=Parasponia andersonii TaxID=3476 RepID=A0A2P5CRT3_PARAD|nr:hypothetical protein PanWU01x14_129030 [Parasponia andersonii]
MDMVVLLLEPPHFPFMDWFDQLWNLSRKEPSHVLFPSLLSQETKSGMLIEECWILKDAFS